MDDIEIYWKDITKEKQQEILEKFGENCNYDIIPIVVICLAEETEDEEIVQSMQ
jgi:hypothetical protein